MLALDLIEALWQGFQMIGKAMLGLVQVVLGFFGLTVPNWTVQIATIIFLVLLVFKFGRYISKILLAVLLLMLASTSFQLLF